MGESKRHKYKRRLGIVATALLVVLLIYFAAQIFGKVKAPVSVISAQRVTDESYRSLNGYVYRNEELITTSSNEIAELLVRNGEKIPVGKEYMTLYGTNISSAAERQSVQSRLDLLNERMELIGDGIYGDLRVQDIGEIEAALDSAYYSLLASINQGNYSSAATDGESVLDSLNKQQIITGRLDSIKSSAEEIENERKVIISQYAKSGGRTLRADASCYVYNEIDGFEAAFSYGDVMTMSVEEFRAGIADIKREGIDNAVGKRVYSSKWYLVVPLGFADLQAFSVGAVYDIHLSEIGGDSIPMTAERVEIAESAEMGFAVLSSSEIDKSFEISRYTSIKLLRSSASGYRVPDEAIYSLDVDDDGYTDYTGVYVMSGNYVQFRRIEISSYGVGYVLARVDDTSSEEEPMFPYLSGSELIIVSGGNLYDGKLIK